MAKIKVPKGPIKLHHELAMTGKVPSKYDDLEVDGASDDDRKGKKDRK